MKTLRRLGIFVAALIVIVSMLALAARTALDADRIKRELGAAVYASQQRTLRIDGELALSFWPTLGIRLGKASLSERNSTTTFATLDSAQLALQWLPLLSRRFVVEPVEVAGLGVTIVRNKDGRLNIADLLEPRQPGTTPVDIAALHLARGRLVLRDERAGREVAFDDIELRSGRIANAAPAAGDIELAARIRLTPEPHGDARFRLGARYALDAAAKRYAARQVAFHLEEAPLGARRLDLAGAAEEIALQAGAAAPEVAASGVSLRAQTGNANTDDAVLALAVPQLRLVDGKLDAAALTLALDVRTADAPGSGVQARLATPLHADLSAQTLAFDKIEGRVELRHPRLAVQALALPLRGSLRADLARQRAAVELAGELDASTLAARIDAARYVPPTASFVVDIDRLELDRYLRPSRDDKSATAADTGRQAPGTARNVDLRGTLNIGELKAAGVKARKLRLAVTLADGRLAVAPR